MDIYTLTCTWNTRNASFVCDFNVYLQFCYVIENFVERVHGARGWEGGKKEGGGREGGRREGGREEGRDVKRERRHALCVTESLLFLFFFTFSFRVTDVRLCTSVHEL